MRSFLNTKAAILVYKNMILPIMEYGDIFLSSLSVATKKKLQTMQNKALKIALNRDPEHCTTALHEEAKLLKLSERRKAHILQFTFKLKRNTKRLLRGRTGRITRSSRKILFKLRKPTTEKYKKCLSYYGLRLWNSLPVNVQTMNEPVCFKNRIKTIVVPKRRDIDHGLPEYLN